MLDDGLLSLGQVALWNLMSRGCAAATPVPVGRLLHPACGGMAEVLGGIPGHRIGCSRLLDKPREMWWQSQAGRTGWPGGEF